MAIRIEADCAGSMWKVLTAPGAEVQADETIAIIESMKMEIPVTAPRAGRIASVLVKEGDAIAEGQTIATLE